MRKVCCILSFLLVTQFSLGCGQKDGPVTAPVKGVVTANGKPVEGVVVSFMVKDCPRVSSGVTNDKGEYELTTFNTNDGAIVGENLVAIQEISKAAASTVSGLDPEAMKQGKTDYKGPSPDMEKTFKAKAKSQNSDATIPPKYGNHQQSGLKRTVVPGEKNNFSFDLKP